MIVRLMSGTGSSLRRFKTPMCVLCLVLGTAYFMMLTKCSPPQQKVVTICDKETLHREHNIPGAKESSNNKSTVAGLRVVIESTLDNVLNISAVTERSISKSTVDGQRVVIKRIEIAPMQNETKDYTDFITGAGDEDLQDDLLNKHKYNYTIANSNACAGEVFLLVVIHSAINMQSERLDIRKTWGSVRTNAGATIVPVFLTGLQDHRKLADNDVQAKLTVESDVYGDIVQGNFVENYKNLTYKNVMGLHWVKSFCSNAKFVLKVDDDTMVDIFHMIDFLSDLQKSQDDVSRNLLYCSVLDRAGPFRHGADKWYVSKEEYPYESYPPYCEGFAYVMSGDVPLQLYKASVYVPFLWIDDVYVTGFLALKAGLVHKPLEGNHGYSLMRADLRDKGIRGSIFILFKFDYQREHWERAWGDILAINGTDTAST